MNPIWAHIINDTIRDVMKVCPHCKKASTYQKKQAGQFYKCRFCGHKFKEKGK